MVRHLGSAKLVKIRNSGLTGRHELAGGILASFLIFKIIKL
tara:strand:+ start:308 stop:430 length:123 start_codon:yes stop_codon:yes gene_type:complete